MKDEILETKNKDQTQEFAENLAKQLKLGDILCLYGDLGSGKTTFVQGLAKGLGIQKRIISPTFIIVRSYKLNNLNFYHIDLYRTQSKADLLGIGLEEILSSKENIVAIEWAERLGDLLPNKRLDLHFKYKNEQSREIVIKNYE